MVRLYKRYHYEDRVVMKVMWRTHMRKQMGGRSVAKGTDTVPTRDGRPFVQMPTRLA